MIYYIMFDIFYFTMTNDEAIEILNSEYKNT